MYTYKNANVTWCPCIKTKVCNNANPICVEALIIWQLASCQKQSLRYPWQQKMYLIAGKSPNASQMEMVTDSYFKVPLTVGLIGLYMVQSMQRGKNIT